MPRIIITTLEEGEPLERFEDLQPSQDDINVFQSDDAEAIVSWVKRNLRVIGSIYLLDSPKAKTAIRTVWIVDNHGLEILKIEWEV